MTQPTKPSTCPRLQSDRPSTDAGGAGRESLEARFKAELAQAPYYSVGRHWGDYAPAYRFGRESRALHRGRRFDEVEAQLALEWDCARAQSRLGWVEARGAVEAAWHLPGSGDSE